MIGLIVARYEELIEYRDDEIEDLQHEVDRLQTERLRVKEE